MSPKEHPAPGRRCLNSNAHGVNTHVLLDNSILGQPCSSPDAEASAMHPGGEHEDTQLVHLWDLDLGPAEAGINYADELET